MKFANVIKYTTKNAKRFDKNLFNFDFGVVQTNGHLVDLQKC